MKAVLFCQNPYAFDIMEPLCEELERRGHDLIWFITPNLENSIPFADKYPVTGSLEEISKFRGDAIFAPGNEVPHYLRGVKIQLFHGFAGEKKGHFRIRHYFDLYLTQGPYFTERFENLATKHSDFKVVETGWCKLDRLYSPDNAGREVRKRIFESSGEIKIVLYAPTFSPSLTSARKAHNDLMGLAGDNDIYLIIKFHDLTDKRIIEEYRSSVRNVKNAEIFNNTSIIPALIAADIMISDTSSAVYEFLLLDKPVITINSRSKNIRWLNLSYASELKEGIRSVLHNDQMAGERSWFRQNYHPYTDGRSSGRVIEATERYIDEVGIPDNRKLHFLGRMKINRLFGKSPSE